MIMPLIAMPLTFVLQANIDHEFYATGDSVQVVCRYLNHWLEKFQKDTKFIYIDTLIHCKSEHGVIYLNRILNFN